VNSKTIVAMTCVKNEGPWLLDWIAHHVAVGFSDFIIASHDCTDGTAEILEAAAKTLAITHLPFTPTGDKTNQWQALKLLSDHPIYQNADLAMFFDVDEYVVSGLSAWEDAPMSERFTMAAPDDIALPLAHFFKTLHRPAAFKGLGVHRPKGKDATWVFANGERAPDQFAQAQGRIQLYGLSNANDRAWLNHYSTRSIEEFILKSARGLPNHMQKPVDAGYWAERNFNVVEDLRIAPQRARAQEVCGTLAHAETPIRRLSPITNARLSS